MVDVLLIEPPPTNKFGNLRTLGSIGTFKADMAWPPLELMIISGYLKKHGISSDIFDANTTKASFADVKKIIGDKNPSLVVFTTSTPTIYNDLKLASITKSISKEIKTIAIGTHIMALPEETLNLCPDLDIACYSESEQVILDLVKADYKPENILGTHYRNNGQIIKNSPHPICHNLDEFGFPSHDKIPLKMYHDPFMRNRPIAVTFSSRGCINQPPCIMCSACFYGKDRYRSADSLIGEMHWLKDMGVKEMRFPFESGFNNLDTAVELFNRMIKENVKIKFTCNGRADRLPLELLKLMKEAGCTAINIGCESADENVLRQSQKKITIQQVRESVANAQKAGLEVLVYFIFGLPCETKQTMDKTLRFAKSLKVDAVTFGIAIPHPGTEFYRHIKQNNFFLTKDWQQYDPLFPPPYNYPNLSSLEIFSFAKRAYRAYYVRPFYIIKRIFKTDSRQALGNNFRIFLAIVKRYLLGNPHETNSAIDAEDEAYFINADVERFRWLTQNRFMAAKEKGLLEKLKIDGANKILEIGCGEGANIYNLDAKKNFFVGIDLFYKKLEFAKSQIKDAMFVCTDALNLPLCDNYFELVFCKDVLHHVKDKDKMLKEMIRVCKPQGRIALLESNGKNLFWHIFGAIIKAERGLKTNTPDRIKQLLENHKDQFLQVSLNFLYTPMFFRFLTHYKFGIKNLGSRNYFIALAELSTRFFKFVHNKNYWAYMVIEGVKK